MNLSELAKIQDPVAKAIIADLTQRLEQLEQDKQPAPIIGFHVKEGERNIETAFKRVRHNTYD